MRITPTTPADLTLFVGRTEELSRLPATFDNPADRLLTLAGPGGIGKSRLAIALARVLSANSQRFPDGAIMVKLAAVEEPDLISGAIGKALGVANHSSARSDRQALERHLSDRKLLLILDNAERWPRHVGELTASLLAHAPGLRIIVTSQEWLNIDGEAVRRLAPLSTPAAGSADPAESEALELLQDRVMKVRPDLVLTELSPAEQAAVAALARQVDGLPLYLELLAVQLVSRSPSRIRADLDAARSTLRAPAGRLMDVRHRDPAVLLDVHYREVCASSEERLLWALISVFRDGFDLAAAQAVSQRVPGEPEGSPQLSLQTVPQLLHQLVQKSVLTVSQDDAGQPRWHQLETLRAYGGLQLEAGGHQHLVRARHAHHFRARASQAANTWFGPDEVTILDSMRRELPNLRAAQAWYRAADNAALEVGLALDMIRCRLWWWSGHLEEGQKRIVSAADNLLAADGASTNKTASLVATTAATGWIAQCRGDQDTAAEAMRRLHTLNSDQPATGHSPMADFLHGTYEFLVNCNAASLEILQRSVAGFGALGPAAAGDRAMAVLVWGMTANHYGSQITAERVTQLCLREATAAGAAWAMSWAQWLHALYLHSFGDPASAAAEARRVLLVQREMREPWGVSWTVELLGWATAATIGQPGGADPLFAAKILGGAQALQRQTGTVISGLVPYGRRRDKAVALVQQHLPAAAFEQAYEAGTLLDPEEVMDLAGIVPGESATARSGLSRREQRAVELMLAGRSNKEIADLMGIKVRTAEAHLVHAYRKLGLAGPNARTELRERMNSSTR